MPTKEFDYKVAPTGLREANAPKRGVRITNPILIELLKGRTLFVEGESDEKLNGFYESARRIGHKLRMRKISVETEEDAKALEVEIGAIGYVMWLKDLEDGNGTSNGN